MHYYKVVDVSVNKQTKIVKNVKITTNRVKMLVDIMIIVSYNSKYKVKISEDIGKDLEWIHCYIHSLKKWLMKIM